MKDYTYNKDYYDNNDEQYEETEEEIQSRNAKKSSIRLLTIIQITVCCMILLTVLLLKVSGGRAYTVIKDWYLMNINQTIIPDEKIAGIKNKVIELFPPSSSTQGTDSQADAGLKKDTSSNQAVSSQIPASSAQAASSQQSLDQKGDKQGLIN